MLRPSERAILHSVTYAALFDYPLRLAELHRSLMGAALDETASAAYDRDLAGRLVAAGAEVAAMTPGHLAAWIAQKVRK